MDARTLAQLQSTSDQAIEAIERRSKRLGRHTRVEHPQLDPTRRQPIELA
jgi:hypothetical protein